MIMCYRCRGLLLIPKLISEYFRFEKVCVPTKLNIHIGLERARSADLFEIVDSADPFIRSDKAHERAVISDSSVVLAAVLWISASASQLPRTGRRRK